MGKFFNKIRQVFNIFLLMALIGVAAAVVTYFLTTPEQRGITFWISAGFIIFALVLETLLFSGVAMRSNNGRNIPVSFTKVILGGLYFLFVVVAAVWCAVGAWSLARLAVIHVVGLVVFLVPMILINMAELRLTGSDRKQQEEGRATLSLLAVKVADVYDDLKNSGVPNAQVLKLSEALRYSDPTPASGKLERALDDAVNNLVEAAKSNDMGTITGACTLAERALRERNEYVKNAK